MDLRLDLAPGPLFFERAALGFLWGLGCLSARPAQATSWFFEMCELAFCWFFFALVLEFEGAALSPFVCDWARFVGLLSFEMLGQVGFLGRR